MLYSDNPGARSLSDTITLGAATTPQKCMDAVSKTTNIDYRTSFEPY